MIKKKDVLVVLLLIILGGAIYYSNVDQFSPNEDLRDIKLLFAYWVVTPSNETNKDIYVNVMHIKTSGHLKYNMWIDNNQSRYSIVNFTIGIEDFNNLNFNTEIEYNDCQPISSIDNEQYSFEPLKRNIINLQIVLTRI